MRNNLESNYANMKTAGYLLCMLLFSKSNFLTRINSSAEAVDLVYFQ